MEPIANNVSITTTGLENENMIVEKASTDDAAFGVLYNFYFPKIYSYIFKRCGDKDHTEDIVSSTFLKVFTNLGSYKTKDGCFSAWVYRIATNNLIDFYRHEGRKREKEYKMDEDFDLPDKKDLADSMDIFDKQIVRAVLANLSLKDQEILNLKFFAELPNTEIAATLDISSNNVGVLLFRALQRFRIKYDESLDNKVSIR